VAVVIGGRGNRLRDLQHFAEAGATCIVTYNHGKEAAKDLLLSCPGRGHWSANVPVEDSSTLNMRRQTSRRSRAGSTCWSTAAAYPLCAGTTISTRSTIG